MTFKNSQEAFEQAISEGRLSPVKAQPNYAGNYMYMGTAAGVLGTTHDLFKNIETRSYDV